MLVEVRLFATFREGRFKAKKMELLEGETLGDLLAELEIPEEKARILLVNGGAASGERRLAGGDVVAVFPPMAGG